MESQTASTEQSVKTIDADIEYIVLGIKKLDAYFADKQVAKKYLTRDGWLDGRGVSFEGTGTLTHCVSYS